MVYDDFSSATLDAERWAAILKGGSVSTSNGQLLCAFSAGVCGAAAQAKTKTVTEGTTTISCKWTPGTHYNNGYGCPYIALVPDGASRDGNYNFPTGVPMLKLGQMADSTNRTLLSVGVSGDGQAISGTSNTVSGTWLYGTQYDLEWVIDWVTQKMTLKVNGSVVIAAAGFTYSPANDLFVELANSGYGGASREERFDDIAFTIPVVRHIGGTITDRFGQPCQRKVYAVSRPTDATAPEILAHGLSDPTTGAYELIIPSSEEVTRVVISEDDDPLLNDIVHRVIPG